jgi:hypothetical protein
MKTITFAAALAALISTPALAQAQAADPSAHHPEAATAAPPVAAQANCPMAGGRPPMQNMGHMQDMGQMQHMMQMMQDMHTEMQAMHAQMMEMHKQMQQQGAPKRP